MPENQDTSLQTISNTLEKMKEAKSLSESQFEMDEAGYDARREKLLEITGITDKQIKKDDARRAKDKEFFELEKKQAAEQYRIEIDYQEKIDASDDFHVKKQLARRRDMDLRDQEMSAAKEKFELKLRGISDTKNKIENALMDPAGFLKGLAIKGLASTGAWLYRRKRAKIEHKESLNNIEELKSVKGEEGDVENQGPIAKISDMGGGALSNIKDSISKKVGSFTGLAGIGSMFGGAESTGDVDIPDETKDFQEKSLETLERLADSTEESAQEQKDQNRKDNRTSAREESLLGDGDKKEGGLLGKAKEKLGIGKKSEKKGGFLDSILGEKGPLGKIFGKKGSLGKLFGAKGPLSNILGGGKGILGRGAGMVANVGSKLPMLGGMMGTAGSALASGATAAAGMAGSAMSGLGALAAANPIGAAVLGIGAAAYGGYKLWDTMRGSEESKEAMDAADEAGVVDHNIFGDSTVLNWDAVKKMSPETVQALIDYDDWDSESQKGLEQIKKGSGLKAEADEAVEEVSEAKKGVDRAKDSTAIGIDEEGNITYMKSYDNGIEDLAGAEASLIKKGYRVLDESERSDLVATKEAALNEKELKAEEALGAEQKGQSDFEDITKDTTAAGMLGGGIGGGLLGGGIFGQLKGLVSGTSEEGKDESTLMEKAFDYSPLGFLSNQLGLTTSESDKESGEKSDIFSRITGTTKDGEDESTFMEKAFDYTPLGFLSNKLGFTESEASKEEEEKTYKEKRLAYHKKHASKKIDKKPKEEKSGESEKDKIKLQLESKISENKKKMSSKWASPKTMKDAQSEIRGAQSALEAIDEWDFNDPEDVQSWNDIYNENDILGLKSGSAGGGKSALEVSKGIGSAMVESAVAPKKKQMTYDEMEDARSDKLLTNMPKSGSYVAGQRMEDHALTSGQQGMGTQSPQNNTVINAPTSVTTTQIMPDRSFNDDMTVRQMNPWAIRNEV